MTIKRIFSKDTLKQVGLFLVSIIESLPDPAQKYRPECQHCSEVLSWNQNFCKSCNQSQVSLSEVYSLAIGFDHYTRIIQATAALILALVGCYIIGIPDSLIWAFFILNVYFIILFLMTIISSVIADWSAHRSNLDTALLGLKLSKTKLVRTAVFWPTFLLIIGLLLAAMSDRAPDREDMRDFLVGNNLNTEQEIYVSDHTVISFFQTSEDRYTMYVGVWNKIIPIPRYKLRDAGIDTSELFFLLFPQS